MTYARGNALLRLAACTAALQGCAVTVVEDAAEGDASRIVAALEGEGIAAAAAADSSASGRFLVEVPRADVPRAVAVLVQQGLPPRPAAGLKVALDGGALVPSRAMEQQRLAAGIAGELERTLLEVDGVTSARVHVAVPQRGPLGGGDAAELAPSASVLVRHRGAESPIASDRVKQLVTFAVPGLAADRVFVTTVAVPPLPQRDLTRFGPITTTRVVAGRLRMIVGGLTLLGLALASTLLYVRHQWARARRALPRRASAPAPGALQDAAARRRL